jgi:hypothetical protein
VTPEGTLTTTFTFGFVSLSIFLDPGQRVELSLQKVEAIATTMISRLAVQIVRAVSPDKMTPVFTFVTELIQQTPTPS